MKLELPKRTAPKQLAPMSAPAYRASLPLHIGEMQKALEIAAVLLKSAGDMYGCGEEHAKIKAWMERVQGINDEATRVIETGEIWRNGEVIL